MLHTGVSPGSIGCAYTYSGPFREAQISEQPLWGFPQVILIVPSHVPNKRPPTDQSLGSGDEFQIICKLGKQVVQPEKCEFYTVKNKIIYIKLVSSM